MTITRKEAQAYMGDEAYDDALRDEGFQEGFVSATKGLYTDWQEANTRRVMREGIMNAQLKQIAQAILELSQFADEPGLTIGSRDNMESIIRIYETK